MCLKERFDGMKINKEILPINKNVYNKLNNLCIFNNLKLEYKSGLIFKMENTNINFIEPHRFIINVEKIVLVILCYDNLNLYLYDKSLLVNIPMLRELIDNIKRGIYNGE